MSPVLNVSKRFEDDPTEWSELNDSVLERRDSVPERSDSVLERRDSVPERKDSVLERRLLPESWPFNDIELFDFCNVETLVFCSLTFPLPAKVVPTC